MTIETELFEAFKLNIWDHQKDALREIVKYLKSTSEKAFLVKMPTGTGKTGVFACLTRIIYPEKNYVIITPSTALKFQIIDELHKGFWEKIKKPLESLPDQIIESLLPSDAETTIKQIENKKFILVTTIQTLQSLSSDPKYQLVIEELRRRTDYIIFDEGHKEPAFTWGETVRAFKKPTILFSATPYRNDYKIFNIDKDNFYSLDHKLCENLNILRQLHIEKLTLPALNPITFVNDLLNQLNIIDKKLKIQGITNPKIIIRCENERDVGQVVKALDKLKKSVVGIHENFKETKNTTSTVPDKNKQSEYDFFVHQYKLIEGIDNPDFCVVALYSDFSNTRLLIQQIGRVLRNPNKKKDQFAYLFCLDNQKIKLEWEKYLDFDHKMADKKKLFDVSDILKVNKEASTLYFSGTFRDLIDVNNLSLTKTLQFQKKVNVFVHDNTTTFDDLSKYILNEWAKRDYFILKYELPDPNNSLLILYIKYENSPLVKDGVFIEQTLSLTYLQFKDNYIIYYDSEQNNPLFQFDTIEPVPRESLGKLFKNKKNITNIFLHNTDIGKNNVRSKELHARSIEYTAPGLTDHSFFPARLEGYITNTSGENRRRYIGFQYGRITDFSASRIEFDEFQKWIVEVIEELNIAVSKSNVRGFLSRFSDKVNPPKITNPASILLDIDSELLEQYTFGLKKENLMFDDLCATVNKNSFILRLNNENHNFQIEYIPKKKKYILASDDLDRNTECNDKKGISIISHLNANQSFRVIVEGNQYVYAYRNFFKPGINLISKKKDLDLRQLFNTHSCITKTTSEKGGKSKPISGNQWHKDSLFGLICRSAKGYGDPKLEQMCGFDYLICDDLGNEIADFIGLDSINKRIVFIHAKAGKSKLSASAFQEICGQATKNLDYLNPYFSKNPEANVKKWNKPWNITGIGSVNRVITGGVTPKAFWNKYMNLMSDPSISREVWLVVGNMFDYASFEKELNKTKIENVKSEVIQLIYLLRSTWSSVSSVGGQLKILC